MGKEAVVVQVLGPGPRMEKGTGRAMETKPEIIIPKPKTTMETPTKPPPIISPRSISTLPQIIIMGLTGKSRLIRPPISTSRKRREGIRLPKEDKSAEGSLRLMLMIWMMMHIN
jgi:hypothetical protein